MIYKKTTTNPAQQTSSGKTKQKTTLKTSQVTPQPKI